MASLDEFLHRLVSPSWLQNGQVTSQAFTATAKDQGKLSFYSGTLFTPDSAYDHFTKGALESAGVIGLTKDDIESVSLSATQDDHPFVGHVSVDTSKYTGNPQKRLAKKLKSLALAHGWLYEPNSNESEYKDVEPKPREERETMS